MPTLVIAASLPPASMTSARPRRIASSPSPIAIVEAAQAVHWEESGPFVPSSIETRLAPMFGMIAVIENGLPRAGPRSLRVSHASSNDVTPPIAVAKETPTRSHSGSMSSPASACACRAAATIICANRSILLACLCSNHCVGSKPFASHANVTGNPVVSNAVIESAVALPATRLSQLDCTSFPRGVTAPSPVITTLRSPLQPISPRCSSVGGRIPKGESARRGIRTRGTRSASLRLRRP